MGREDCNVQSGLAAAAGLRVLGVAVCVCRRLLPGRKLLACPESLPVLPLFLLCAATADCHQPAPEVLQACCSDGGLLRGVLQDSVAALPCLGHPHHMQRLLCCCPVHMLAALPPALQCDRHVGGLHVMWCLCPALLLPAAGCAQHLRCAGAVPWGRPGRPDDGGWLLHCCSLAHLRVRARQPPWHNMRPLRQQGSLLRLCTRQRRHPECLPDAPPHQAAGHQAAKDRHATLGG